MCILVSLNLNENHSCIVFFCSVQHLLVVSIAVFINSCSEFIAVYISSLVLMAMYNNSCIVLIAVDTISYQSFFSVQNFLFSVNNSCIVICAVYTISSVVLIAVYTDFGLVFTSVYTDSLFSLKCGVHW